MKALSFDDIQLVPRYNNIASRKDVDTSVQFGELLLEIPVFSANMDSITGPRMAHKMYELGGLGFLHRFCSVEDNVRMYKNSIHEIVLEEEKFWDERTLRYETWGRKAVPSVRKAVISVGVNEGLDRFEALYEAGARYFCVDVAHGHSKAVGDIITLMRKAHDDAFIVAGNVCTSEGAEYLADKGAQAIKVGIGPGSVCSTRIKTGFGIPQFTAIQECRHVNCFLIADGGIRTPGDAVKAFAAGADAIMLGGMLAGTDETPGEVQYATRGMGKPTPGRKVFRGMASKEAQDDHMGSMSEWKTAEGIEIQVDAKGPVEAIIGDLMGGIRSGLTYCGANNISQIRERARWTKITAAGVAEGKPHGKGRL